MKNAYKDRWPYLVLILLCGSTIAARAAEPEQQMADWGRSSLASIEKSFFMPGKNLYAEMANDGKKPHPSWIWDASVQLQALCAAARMDRETYLPAARAYAVALRSYRFTWHNRPGFDVNPPPKNPDRYYDDNAWISLALLETYDLTKDLKDLELAIEAYEFAVSGEDKVLGGGIYWHEDNTRSKNACSSGPTMLAALRLYQLKKDQVYLDTAKRYYAWTLEHLQDKTDGLIYDSITVANGRINRAKFTYNSATMISAAVGLYRITHEQVYLDEAHRIAKSAEKHFVRAEDGIITGAGKLAVKLVEAYLDLDQIDHDGHWRDIVAKAAAALHGHQNTDGLYPQDWNAAALAAGQPARLIDQAAPARTYWLLAATR